MSVDMVVANDRQHASCQGWWAAILQQCVRLILKLVPSSDPAVQVWDSMAFLGKCPILSSWRRVSLAS